MLDFLYNLIIYPLIQIIEIAYLVVWKVFKNSGYAVLGVSVAVTFLCLPLYIVAESWQEKERAIQQKLKPGVDRIKAVFKGDEQYMILSTYYRQNHYHPMMALRSSFGLLIQVPFFIAAYNYLSHLEELRGFSFYFIRDLGAPDALFSIGGFAINVLPIAMTLINCVAGAIYTKGFPFKEKLQIYGMALVFLVLLYNSPAGLVLYWTMNNILSLIKNIFYKLKRPLIVLYICLCIGVLFIDYFLLFHHNGFLYRRLMLICAVSSILVAPLVLKFIQYLLRTFLKPLVDNTRLCTILFFSASGALFVLMGYVLPSFVIASSPPEFSFIDSYESPFFFLFNATTQALGFLIFWPTCLYFLFGKKIKTLFAVFFSVVALGGLINAFMFPGDYGMLSPILTLSNAGILKASSSTNIINLLVLLIPVVLVCFFIWFKKIQWFTSIIQVIGVALVAIAIFNSVKISSGYSEFKTFREETAITRNSLDPVFNLSKTEENVFVIMLDRAISSFIPYILEEKPELREMLEGFVYYPNTMSYSDHTLIGAPPLYGGYDYTPLAINNRSDVPLVDKHNEALLVMPRLFSDYGFETTMTDSSWANYSWISDMRIYNPYPEIKTATTIRTYTDFWLKSNPESSEQGARSALMKRNFIWYSFLKMMPTLFRDTIYNDGFYWNTNKSLEDLQDVVNNYAVLDYLPELTSFEAQSGTYTFMVNEMTHEPAYLQAPDYVPLAEVTDKGSGPFAQDVHYHANIGALLRVAEWIEYIKENGAYDNTRIIIVSDHGAGITSGLFDESIHLPFRRESMNPLLLLKDFNATGELSSDMTFMSTADVPFLSVEGIIENPVNPFTNNPISMDEKKDGEYIANSHLWSPDGQNKNTFKIADNEWYHVKDNIFVDSNWTQEVPQ